MKKEKKDKDFLHKPVYPGGIKAIRQLIREQLRYPAAALSAGVEGTVYLKYTIDYKGKVNDVKVVSGLGYGCDEEAVRLVKLLKFEVPRNRKIKVLFSKSIQIHFRINKKEEQPLKKSPAPPKAVPALQYQYTTTRKDTSKPEDDTGDKGYTYTISW